MTTEQETNPTKNFIDLIKRRSHENEESLNILFKQGLIGNCISILRQELDTFIRVIYLGRQSNLSERERLMKLTLNGEKWRISNNNNRTRNIADREMVDLSMEVKGYVQYVYKFGCSFIHLSNYHNYEKDDPFKQLPLNEQLDIILYLNQYHGFPKDKGLSVLNIVEYIPKIFEKISANMMYYNEQLIKERIIDF